MSNAQRFIVRIDNRSRYCALLFVLLVSIVAGIYLGVRPGRAERSTDKGQPRFANPTSTVFINEILYDITGTDAGEFVEVAAPAGTNMANYSIVLYNGSGGTLYDTDALSGTTTNQQGGYGTVSISYPSNGIQNGSPDGIALVNTSTNTLVQFLCYEGTFAATNGIANGVTCTDIGVSQSGSNAAGTSLQLQGSGTTYGDFTWNATSLAHTQDLPNTGQTFTGGGGDAAPTVNSTTPANAATNVAVNANVMITFSEAVTVSSNSFTISCGTSGTHTFALTGSTDTYTLNPDTDFAGGETCTVTVVANQVADQDAVDPPDNMAMDFVFSFTTVALAGACGDSFTPIYNIQGSGPASPLPNGTNVNTEGVVTGDFQLANQQSGFYIQDPTGDANTATSDGIFVFAPSTTDVSVGDRVRVTGQVTEFNTMTEINNVTSTQVCSTGNSLPSATVYDLPEPTLNDLERVEGMRVTFPEALSVTGNNLQGRFGEVMLASDGRLFQQNSFDRPNSAGALARAELNARRQIMLDDGMSIQNPNPIPYIGADNTLRAGDTVTNLTVS